MTPYPLIPPKVHPLVAHTKNKVFGVYLKQIHPKTTMSVVIHVYKSNHTSQPTVYVKYKNIVFFH